MSNLSYCRFYNTYHDLYDCMEHIDDELESEEEERARNLLVQVCRDIVNEVNRFNGKGMDL